jgi:hypothetical protein
MKGKSNMHRPNLVLKLLALVALAGCASTSLVSSWKDPAVGSLPFKKVVVCAMSQDVTLRRIAEDTFVKGLPKEVQGLTAYSFVPEAEMGDVEKVKARLVQAGVDGAIVYRLVGVEKQTTYVPPTAYATPYYAGAPYYGGFGPYWGYSYSVAYSPGYLVEDKIVQVECNAYSVNDEKLAWTARSESVNPSGAQQVIDEVVLVTVARMRTDKVLP